jgi:predicted membrane protein
MATPGRSTTQLVVGIIVILLGLVLLLDNMNLLDARDYFRFWPFLLIVLGGLKIFQPQQPSSRAWGVILILAGGLFLLRTFDVYYIRFRDFWPLLLILAGGAMLWGSVLRRRVQSDGATDDAILNGSAILGGFNRSVTTQDFRGGDLTAIMGGCEIDLRKAAIRGDEAVLNVFAFWGGMELQVPENWTVVTKAMPIMGGVSDETRPTTGTGTKRLVITGTVVMGGVEVKN